MTKAQSMLVLASLVLAGEVGAAEMVAVAAPVASSPAAPVAAPVVNAVAVEKAAPAAPAGARLTSGSLDAVIERALAKAGKPLPAPQSPELLLRRLSIDLTGVIPRATEVREARTGGLAAVDRWLAKTEAGPDPRRHLSERLAALLLGRRGRLEHTRFEEWLAKELERDRRVLPLWSRIVSSTGVYPDEPSAGWFVRFQGDPAELTTQVSRAMLGESMGCARCHDHPFARWKRTDFLGLAASFAQTGYTEQPEFGGEERIKIWDRGWGDVYADEGRAIAQAFPGPRAPGAPSVPPSGKVTSAIGSMGMASLGMPSTMTMSGAEPAAEGLPEPVESGPPRRSQLAGWMSRPDNAMPARALANRVWGWLMGKPVVTPVHDLEMGVDELPGVLDALGAHLIATGGDVQDLMQILVRTRAYRARREDAGPFPPRRLSLEELAAALERLAERPGLRGEIPRTAKVDKTSKDDDDDDDDDEDSRGRLADLLTNAGTEDLGESADSATIARGLFLVGGGALGDPAGRMDLLRQRVEVEKSEAGAAEWLFEAALSRAPRPAERAWLAARLAADRDRQRALGDALWALVNCAEFGVSR